MKKFIALALSLCILAAAFISCSSEAEKNAGSTLTATTDIVGSWSCVTAEEENVFTFNSDGTLSYQVYMLGRYAREDKGTYDADGSSTKINLENLNVDASYSFNEYNNLVLTFNGQTNTYKKVKPFTTDEYKEENGYFTALWADVPTPVGMFTDSHFANESTAYNYEIRESKPQEAEYGVNYNYFFADEDQAQEAFSKYYTYLLQDKFSLPKDSESLKERIEKEDLDRNVEKESKFEISRNILVSNYTDEEIGIGLCYDKNEKRVVLSVTLFNKDYDPDDYVADRKIKINYVYKDVIVTKHRSNINPDNYHIVSTEVVLGGNKLQTPSTNSTPNSSVDNTNQDTTPSQPQGMGEVVKVNITPLTLSDSFKQEVEGIERSKDIDTYWAEEDPQYDASVINVDLNKTEVHLKMGEKFQLEATTTPASGVDTNMMYTCDNETNAVVDANGVIYGLKPGVATITVTSYSTASIERTCTVIVYANEGDETESQKLVDLINAQRSTPLSATTDVNGREADTNKLRLMANQRSYEEAYENDGVMDANRPDGSSHDSVFEEEQYDYYKRANTSFFIWGKDYDAQTVFDQLKDSEAGNTLLNDTTYTTIGVGYFKDDASGVVFWTIMLVNPV